MPFMNEENEKVKEFASEVYRYAVAEVHVHAFLSGVVIIGGHYVSEHTSGIAASAVLIVATAVWKRQYPHRVWHLIRLDRLYHRVTGKIVVIDKKDYVIHKGYFIPAEHHFRY